MTTSTQANSNTKTNNPKANKKSTKSHDKPNILHKIFGGLNMSWPVVIILAIIMGAYTALMALLVPDGNSFHDIAVTTEWWVLPAILIIANCKKPLDAALKVFVFFLISQPLVYLIQVPFHPMGWSLFSYYPYWFKITLATLPAGFIGWYMKKDKWYSGLILSSMTSLLVCTAIIFIRGFNETFPNHLITVIYCLAIIPIFIFGIFRKWQPRIIAIVITIIAAIICVITSSRPEQFEIYRTGYDGADYAIINFDFGTNPEVTSWSSLGGGGDAEIINVSEGTYSIKLTGSKGSDYYFTVTDDSGKDYDFHYYYNEEQKTIILELAGAM